MNGFLLCPEWKVPVMVDGGAGKGDRYRKVDQKKWDEGWESAFGKKKEKKMKFNNKVIDMTKIDKKENENERSKNRKTD